MAGSTDVLMQLAAQRAGLSGEQIDALRRGDFESLLSQPWPSTSEDLEEVEELRQSLRAANRQLRSVEAQLQAAMTLLHQIADLVGCCRRCWGTNELCPFCGGRGTPGFRRPDPGLASWIEPALQRAAPAPPPPTYPDLQDHTRQGEAND